MNRQTLLIRSEVDWGDHTGLYPLLYDANFYVGCQHNCRYCYAGKTYCWREEERSYQYYSWKEDWENVEPVHNAVELAETDVARKEAGRVMVCSLCDPYQPIEKELRLTQRVLNILLDTEFYVLILTKSDLVRRDFPHFQGRDNVELGFTVTALRDLPEWEPRAPGNTRRIEALKKAHDLGIRTFVSVEPWIPNTTRPREIMDDLGPWVDRWIVGTLNFVGVYHDFYRRHVPDLIRYVRDQALAVQWKLPRGITGRLLSTVS